jgi:hypothetical protein
MEHKLAECNDWPVRLDNIQRFDPLANLPMEPHFENAAFLGISWTSIGSLWHQIPGHAHR